MAFIGVPCLSIIMKQANHGTGAGNNVEPPQRLPISALSRSSMFWLPRFVGGMILDVWISSVSRRQGTDAMTLDEGIPHRSVRTVPTADGPFLARVLIVMRHFCASYAG